MTNKTITLAQDHIERLIDRLSKAQMFKEVTELRAAMAQPVRPLAGVPERHDLPHRSEFESADQHAGATGEAKAWNAACDAWEPHVTRLQAEVERLKQVAHGFVSEIELKDTELTKARQLLADVAKTPWMYDVLGSVREYVANQSAPADKGQGEPVAWLVESPSDLEPINGVAYTKDQADMYRAGRWNVRPVYAEQPAPVAAVMPERFNVVMQYLMGIGDLDGYYFRDSHPSGRKYWWRNELRACLDEFGRLNSEPKP